MPKPTPDCRATERKHPWPMVRLGDVCEIEFGTRVRRKDSRGGDYPVYGGGGATFCWDTYNREDQCIVSRFAMSEECVRFVKGKFFLNDSGLSVRSGITKLSQTYLDWVLYSKQPDIYALGRGAAQKNLDVEQFADMEIPLPPLAEQKEIVARLERELAAVEKMKKGFEALAETAMAEFEAERLEVHKELLHGEWPCEPLKKHVDVLAGYAFKSQGFVDSGIRICGGLIIAPDRIKWEECKYWKSSKGIEQYLLHENDLVIALDRPWISGGFKIGVIGKRDLPCLLIQRTARLRMKDVDFRYVMMLLRDESFKLHCTTSGTTVPHISHKDIETYEIPFPPARVQKEIVDRLSAVKARAEKLEAKAREGVAVCETMRKAILKEAFA